MKWSITHAVFLDEIDDEHKEIFEAVGDLQNAIANGASPEKLREITERLAEAASGHFAHEERLMRASRYESLGWHRRQHNTARKRIKEYVPRIQEGDTTAAMVLVAFLNSWLPKHTRLADRMMAAFLRNFNLCRVTINAA